MSEVKDPKIKLFGKTIELPENSAAADEGGEPGSAGSCEAAAVGDNNSSNQDPPCSSDSVLEDGNFLSRDAEEQESVKPPSDPAKDHAKDEDQPEPSKPDELKDSNTPPPVVDDSKTEEDQTETANSNEKTLKKPDKILPCPRCNSMDTKFCYFNNYNVNQPRHFCKNCQRYWTAGGSMRNVPVGAGRRKNKNPISQFRHLTVPEALQTNTARVDLPNGILSPNGTVLTFGSDSPLCESITSVLNIVDKTDRNGSKNGVHRPEENGDALSSRSSITSSEPEPMINRHPFSPQVPCYPGPRWPYPWPPPAFSPASFPVPFYSTAPPYWGWNVPWVIPPGPTHSTSGPNSPTLGKHSRDENNVKDDSKEEETLKQSNPEKCLWVPKTLRIDDPGEAAKSSIWATLGIKNDMADCGGGGDGGGLFKAFRSESKGDEKARVSESSTVLQANPAALSRSLSFHENT